MRLETGAKHLHCVDLGESFLMGIYFQKSASIQPRKSPVQFACSPCTDPPDANSKPNDGDFCQRLFMTFQSCATRVNHGGKFVDSVDWVWKSNDVYWLPQEAFALQRFSGPEKAFRSLIGWVSGHSRIHVHLASLCRLFHHGKWTHFVFGSNRSCWFVNDTP